jgi:hypothetical protein
MCHVPNLLPQRNHLLGFLKISKCDTESVSDNDFTPPYHRSLAISMGPELQSLSPDWDNLYEYQADYAGSVFRADVTVRDSY